MFISISIFILSIPFLLALIIVSVSFGCLLLNWRLRQPGRERKLNVVIWLRCFLYEWLCVTQVYYLRIIYRLGYRSGQHYQQTDKVPVVLLHGYTDTPLVWYWFKRQLSKQYDGPVYAIALKPALAPIETIAESLNKDLIHLLHQTQAKKINIVGHSMGGLVAYYWLLNYKKGTQVSTLISLGTPWQGTKMSCFGLGENAKQMNYNSTFSQNLLKQAKPCVKLINVASLCDNIVIPWQSAMGCSQAEPITVTTGHVSLTFSTTVFKIVLNELLFTARETVSTVKL